MWISPCYIDSISFVFLLIAMEPKGPAWQAESSRAPRGAGGGGERRWEWEKEKGPAWLQCGALARREHVRSPQHRPSSLLLGLLEPSTFAGYPAKERKVTSHHSYHLGVQESTKRSQNGSRKRLPGSERKREGWLPLFFPTCMEGRLSIFNTLPFKSNPIYL